MKEILCISALLLFMGCTSRSQESENINDREESMYTFKKSEQEWKGELSSEEYKVLRQCGTELPGTGKYYHHYEPGKYICAACGQVLFDSETKYASGSGWPSFYDVISGSNVVLIEDNSIGMIRTEVKCSKCGSHLGHVFPDGPAPTNQRYCINSVAMGFIPRDSTDIK